MEFSDTKYENLNKFQLKAIDCVHQKGSALRDRSEESIRKLFTKHQLNLDLDHILKSISKNARVTLNFHPDRILQYRVNVVEGLLQDGIYQSQFVTRISNGSCTAYAGGDRDLWEKSLFEGAYHHPEVLHSDRPKYGGLNLMEYTDGASPRFGSCHFRLKPHVKNRCTFTFGDSHMGPERVGTIDSFESVIAALLEHCDSTQQALGTSSITVSELVDHLLALKSFSSAGKHLGQSLDDYIEAQVHGPVDLSKDIEALVVDPSFQQTPIGDNLEKLSTKYSFPIYWHSGFRLAPEAVPDSFRGPEMPPLALRLDKLYTVKPGLLDAYVIGRAAASVILKPETWEDWGTQGNTLQHLKQLWHILVKYGGK
jgi:hypothetical protein